MLSSLPIFAQEFSVSGKIQDDENEAIAYATVLLKSEEEETLSGVSSDEEGSFIFKDVTEGTYIISCSFIGFKTVNQKVTITSNRDVGILILTPEVENIEGVTVVGKLPTVKKLADRTIFNVANTALTNGSTWNVLQKTPQIIAVNNELMVKGMQPTIYINNKKVYLSASEVQQLLENTPASSIQSVEVITNPSAKYDAQDAMVVNINMTKNIATGYNGSVFGNVTQGIYPKYNAGIAQFYKTDKLNVFLSYAYNKKKIDRITDEYAQFFDEETPAGEWKSHLDLDTWSENHTVSANVDYDFSEKSSLSFSAMADITPYWKRNTDGFTSAYNTAETIDSTFHSINNTYDNKNNVALNLGYEKKLDEDGQKISILAHHTFYNKERDQDVVTNYFDALGSTSRTNHFTTDQDQDITISTAQIDYSLPMENDMALEAGIKGVQIDTDSDLVQESLSESTEVLDNNYQFDYTESNLAAYMNLSKSWTKWNVRAGFRTEYTDAEGTAADATNNNSFDYVKWFPSAGISYDPSSNHSFSASYRKSITRPSYERLNPFRFYLTDNSYVSGNSALLPAIKQYMSLDYTYQGMYTASVFYKHISNPMSELSFQENDNRKLKYVAANLEREASYGLDLYVNKSISNRWFLYFESTTFYNKLQFFAQENENQLVDNNRWTGWLFLGNYFTFLKDNSLLADVTYLYILPANDANAQVTGRSNFSISLSKSLWNNRASLSLQANDIFNGQIFTSTTEYLNQNNSYRARYENRTILLGFKYKFGNYRLSNNKKDIDVEERERL